jgi:hypothetical protein
MAAMQEEPLVYRTEVLATIGALADLVVVTRDIRDLLVEGEGGEEEPEA